MTDQQWWLCPNLPRCPHGAILHDIQERDDPLPRCCADGCDCGDPQQALRNTAAQVASGGA